MGRLIHTSNKKLLRYWNFTNSITQSYDNRLKESYIKQTFGGYTYELLQIHADDNIDRTSRMSYDNMNATLYNGTYNLKLHEKDGYWGNGTMYQTSDYLVKEENVIPYTSLSDIAIVRVVIPNTLISKLLTTYIYFFVTLDNSILGYNGSRYPVGADFPRDSEIYPYDNMATDYMLRYKFNTNDKNKYLYISTNVPAKKDCYANVFIFIPNRKSVACSIKYNGSTAYSYTVDENFLHAQVLRYTNGPGNTPDTLMTGTGYSLYVDGEILREAHDDYAGEAEITFNNIS